MNLMYCVCVYDYNVIWRSTNNRSDGYFASYRMFVYMFTATVGLVLRALFETFIVVKFLQVHNKKIKIKKGDSLHLMFNILTVFVYDKIILFKEETTLNCLHFYQLDAVLEKNLVYFHSSCK